MSKFTRDDLKNWFRDTHRDAQPEQAESKDGLLTESYGDMNDPMSHKEYTSSGTFSSAGSEERHAARRREERGSPDATGRDLYALIEIPYEGSIVLSADTLEELRSDIDNYTSSGHASLAAIFYADIIEGEL